MGGLPSTARLAEPDSGRRWRCAGCGNLTRFDVVVTRRTSEFWHVDLAGNPSVDETSTLESVVESVTCRWCGASDAIEVVDRPDADAGAESSAAMPAAEPTGSG